MKKKIRFYILLEKRLVELKFFRDTEDTLLLSSDDYHTEAIKKIHNKEEKIYLISNHPRFNGREMIKTLFKMYSFRFEDTTPRISKNPPTIKDSFF